MCDSRTNSQAQFAAEFAKHFGEESTLTERGFCQPLNDRTVVGSLVDLGGKTSKLKAEDGIDTDTWVCHVYVNDVDGNYITDSNAVYTSFEEMMDAINPSS